MRLTKTLAACVAYLLPHGAAVASDHNAIAITALGPMQQTARQPGNRVAFGTALQLRNPGDSDTDMYWAIAPSEPFAPVVGPHAFVVARIYLLDNGSLRRIGAAEAFHVPGATNTGCASTGFAQVLRPTCSTGLSVTNTTDAFYMAPDSEIDPLSGAWSATGSSFDGTPIDGVRDRQTPGDLFDRRLVVNEGDLQRPVARWFLEVQAVSQSEGVRHDNLAWREFVPTLSTTWTIAFTNAMQIGTAIAADGSRLQRLTSPNGDLWLATHTTDLGGGSIRLTLRLLNATRPGGPIAFTVRIAPRVASNPRFVDVDTLAPNDWTSAQSTGAVTWTQVPAQPNALRWGAEFEFAVDLDGPLPDASSIEITYADGTTSVLLATIFQDGFE